MTSTYTYIKSKTKNKCLVLFFYLCITVSLSSCIEFIDKPIDPYATIETEQALNDYMIGLYAQLSEGFRMYNTLSVKSDDINLQMHFGIEALSGYPAIPFTDEYLPTIDLRLNSTDYYGEWIYSYKRFYTYYNDISLEFYRAMYRAILMSNKIINDISVDDKKEKWADYLGEAYFMRAYSYFKLARVFGRLPLVLDINVNFELPLAQFTEIYSQIENDLITAVSYLPENRNSSRKGTQTPHQGTAKALLSEVYLTMGGYPVNDPKYYTKAAETAREVIENAEGYGFGLMDDFANLWQWTHRDNKESVWNIYYQGENFNPKAVTFQKADEYSLEPFAIETITTEEYFYNNFPKNYRKEITFWHYQFEGSYGTENILSGNEKKTILVFKDVAKVEKTEDLGLHFLTYSAFLRNVLGKKQVVNFSCYSDNMIKTFYPPHLIIAERPSYYISNQLDLHSTYDDRDVFNKTHDSIRAYINAGIVNPEFITGYSQFFHILRFAHTLLTYAEASARSGNPDALAYESVNRVRRRANKLPVDAPSVYDLPQGLSAAAFADSVVAERSWEFCHEFEGRWNDIIRLQLYPQVEENRFYRHFPDRVNQVYNGNTYFIPIPQEEVWLNPNLGGGSE